MQRHVLYNWGHIAYWGGGGTNGKDPRISVLISDLH